MSVKQRICPPRTGKLVWCVRREMPDRSSRHQHFGSQRRAEAAHRTLIVEAEAMRADRAAGRRPRRGLVTYRQFVADVYLPSKNVRSATLVTVKDRLSPSLDFFGDKLLSEIEEQDVSLWLAALQRSDYVKRKAWEEMRYVLNAALAFGFLHSNPVVKGPGVSLPRPRDPKPQPLHSWAQVEKVGEACQSFYERGKAYVLLGATTGLRPEEQLALRELHVDHERGLLYVRETFSKGQRSTAMKTPRSRRDVILSRRALDALDLLPWTGNADALLFSSPQGGHWRLDNFRNRVWYPALAAAGVGKRGPGQLRHTYATILLAEGRVSISDLAHQMGNSVAMIERHYEAWIEDRSDRLRRALNAA